MARSGKHKATHYFNRRPRPGFKFTKLPLDLQFLVLCNCDLTGIATLIKANPSLRNLCLRYPGTVIQNALEEIPGTVATLLHVTIILESVIDDRFDARDIYGILDQEGGARFLTGRSKLFTVKDDGLRVESLVSIYAEVKAAADIVVQAMGAAMQVSLDHLIVVTPIVPSAAEQLRMMCALLVIRIYYQLRFQCSAAAAAAFVGTLTPCQMVQGSSIKEFVDCCVKEPRMLLDKKIDKRYTCRESLSQKSLFLRDYIKATVADMEKGYDSGHKLHIPRYSDAVRAELAHRRQRSEETRRRARPILPSRLPSRPAPGRQLVAAGELGCLGSHPIWRSADPLRSYGWVVCPMLHGYMRTQRVVFRCGVLFWDQNRLEDWNVTRGADIEELGRWAAKLYTRYFGSLQKDCEEETRSRQIVEWTRSHVQITFDEFLAKQEGKGQ